MIDKYNKESLIFFLHAFLHQKLVFLADVVSFGDLLFNELQKFQGADRTLRCGLEACFNADRVEVVEAKYRSYFIPGFYIVVANGTFANLALVLRFD